MMQRYWWLAGLCVAAAAGTPERAEACGGCFAPAGAVQVVTDHRMVLSLSSTQTTLWDQFTFAGDPNEFSWILPMHYDPSVSVRIADDRFMTIMENITAPVMVAPPPQQQQYCYGDPAAYPDAAYARDAAASDSGVVVYREESVGPYAVAIVGGEDPMAIRDWMTANGYSIPPGVSPVIDYYTSQHMDFLALKLRPAQGTSRIAPVRISMAGYQPALPLRMIAAGVGDNVNLVLMTLSAARIEAQNFPNGEISEDSLTYDYNHPTSLSSDFLAAYDRLDTAAGHRLWLTESVIDERQYDLDSLATQATYGMPRTDPACADAGSGSTDDAGMSTCAPPDPHDDVAAAFSGLGSIARVTRMRAELGPTALDRDLLLQASDLGLRDRYYHYGHILNVPPPPPPCDAGSNTNHDAGSHTGYDAGGWSEAGAHTDAAVRSDGARGDGSAEPQIVGGCSAARAPGARGSLAALGLALGVMLTARRRRNG